MKVIEEFLEKEKEYKMYDKKVLGIYYWEYVRGFISNEANTIISKSSPMFASTKLNFKKLFPNLKKIKDYFLRNRKADILIITQPRRIKCKKGFRNNYTDYYEDVLKKKYKVLNIEEPSWTALAVSDCSHSFPLYTENIYLVDFHEILFLIRKQIFKILHHNKYSTIIDEYNKVNIIVNDWFKRDDIYFKEYFIDSVIRLYIDQKYIKKLINTIKPKIVLLHYMPSIFKQMLVVECNSRKIKTIEIQHGTITKTDPILNKTLLVDKKHTNTDYIFAFGTNQVNKYALAIKDYNNLKMVGFPFFEELLSSLKSQNKKYILIISQSTIGKEIAEFTSRLSEIIKDKKIVFKYHPSEITRNYECLKKNNIIEIRNESNIYELQNQSFLQIGVYSTSLYEGFAMGIPTLIISNMFGASGSMKVFEGIEQGVYFIKTPSDVLNYLEKNDIIPLQKDKDKLWMSNSKKNILKYIDEIMKEIK